VVLERSQQRLRTPNTASVSRYCRLVEDVRDQRLEAVRGDLEVHVRGPHRPRPAASSSSPTGPSAGIGYASGLTDQKPEAPVLAGLEVPRPRASSRSAYWTS
jgi:hypothetical protein